MKFHDLQWQEWNSFDERQIRRCAVELMNALPYPINTWHTITRQYVDHQIRTILFLCENAWFAFIPGGQVQLGYDGNRFNATKAQLQSYEESREQYQWDKDIFTFIDELTSPPRQVSFSSFLIEVKASEIGLEPIFPNEPEVRKILKQIPHGDINIEVHKEFRVRRNAGGNIEAWRIVSQQRENITNELASGGFRLPTSDEWEYACGAGVQTLFRWGNGNPCTWRPTDNAVLKFARDWVPHLQPNLFGLIIAQNPYDLEIVAEENVVRGGDGGDSICGGIGVFETWLPLATAYFDQFTNNRFAETADLSNHFMRRVIAVP